MVARPPLPDDYDLPTTVGPWVHNPDSGKNAHVWSARDHPVTVGVFGHLGTATVKVFDDRVDGFRNSVAVAEYEYDGDGDTADQSRAEKRAAVGDALDDAIDWMADYDPGEWSHSMVCEAVFDAPVGYELDRYYLEERTAIVYYRRENAEKVVRLAGAGGPDEYTPETCPYLYVHVWRGSGKATVALAPWLRAHGPASKYPELREIADPPEECGLEVAVTVARQWAREEFGGETDPGVGQADLAAFSGGSA